MRSFEQMLEIFHFECPAVRIFFLNMNYQTIPKAELHVHLDGSLRVNSLLELVRQQNLSFPFNTEAGAIKALCFQPGWDLTRCLNSFATTLQVLQTPENIERVTYELCEDLHRDGVTYAEIRYCPSLHLQQGMDHSDVVNRVASGMSQAEIDFGITARQILTILRNFGNDAQVAQEEADALVRLATSTKHQGVVGIDLAGDEYHFPPELFAGVFTYARDAGLHRTVHAGEGGSEMSKNILTSVQVLHAERIGHGVAARYDPTIVALLRDRNIAVEVCPTSNIHTGSVKDYQDHPAGYLFDQGVTIVPCADNTFLSQTTTSQEYAHLARHLNFTDKELIKIARDSFKARFC